MNYRKIISVGDGRDAFTHLFEQSSFAAKYILEFFYSRIKPRTGQMIFENTGFFVTAKSLPKISLAWILSRKVTALKRGSRSAVCSSPGFPRILF